MEEKLKKAQATINSLLAECKARNKTISVLEAAGLVTEEQFDAAYNFVQEAQQKQQR